MDSLMECLIHDSEVAIDWFHNKFKKENPSKFQFMLLKPLTIKEDLPDHILINNTIVIVVAVTFVAVDVADL